MTPGDIQTGFGSETNCIYTLKPLAPTIRTKSVLLSLMPKPIIRTDDSSTLKYSIRPSFAVNGREKTIHYDCLEGEILGFIMIKGTKIIAFLLLAIALLTTSSCIQHQEISVIPQPNRLETSSSSFAVNEQTMIVTSDDPKSLTEIAGYISDQFETAMGFSLKLASVTDSDKPDNAIWLRLDNELQYLGTEGYNLSVSPDLITIEAYSPAGIFYGVQTLRQLLPPEIESPARVTNIDWQIPCLQIEDTPRYKWRGLLLDCCRHFMTKEFVKRYIDLLAYHKMNTLHWHLTEDQGWRIEIKKYPRLTEIGAWRRGENGEPYGGYYSQDDIREIVAYAESRFVNIVPEIEFPGHATAALAAYPQYSCTGGPFEVGTVWGVYKDVYCPGNEKTFEFLEDILGEVIELFPGKYIHIGGDECPKDRWQNHDLCQKRIKDEGLKNEHELQSYFIRRMEKYLNSKNKRLIGWDEIMEGGLAPEATVQVWRDMDFAAEAAKAGHDVIASPTSHAYFDYPTDVTDLRQVYTFEPAPETLNEEEKDHILGGECNMWSERAPQEKVDSKVFPRILAMSEVLWTKKNNRDFDDFHGRIRKHYERLDYLGVEYGPESKPTAIHAAADFGKRVVEVTITSGEADMAVHYTVSRFYEDSCIPSESSPKYFKPLSIDKPAVIKAASFRDGKMTGEAAECVVNMHKAFGKKVEIVHPFSSKYSGIGNLTLTNGIFGTHNFRDGQWLGFEGVDFEAVVDLGNVIGIEKITTNFLQNASSWIFLPRQINFYISSDGVEYTLEGSAESLISPKDERSLIIPLSAEFDKIEGRYVKIHATNRGTCPDWHPGAGGKSWVFIDEIVVE
ncbi:beta-N-acetylhexosaminidase [candidate division LCP-89 bacterium B3_LCP]|uniref:beta-N-acetylhexosaminidase n=1 Tax=candidate division LCP-89 bacterium B3_LCP TaxID=2012998 RepID=A0A532USL1_UNCL8|nr:MAG: beta-N-acetylhexosaminidase [candidate division LCP-89 bacterium B3_LCP]